MDLLKNSTHIYFVGIGGIGMSALARYFKSRGKVVAGYDKTPTAMTEHLKDEGIPVCFEDDPQKILSDFDKKTTMVVFTPAVSSENKLLEHFQKNSFLIKKRAYVLGMITRDVPTLAVAGTHGKTTTTAILAHILKQSGLQLTAFLGGISENYHTNFINDGDACVVVEADEFDRSFLQLSPSISAITSMDADHLDIYGEEKTIRESFVAFAEKVSAANLIVAEGLGLPGNSVGFQKTAAYQIQEVRIDNGSYFFDFQSPAKTYKNIQFSLPGKHNLMNAGTALAMALKFGVKGEQLVEALPSFKGVERRFTYHLKTKHKVLIEDYAHHPKEIAAVYQAVSTMHPQQKTLAVFQPHLYSRTRDFADEFAQSLSLFAEVILLEVYPAREKPIPGIDASFLLKKIKGNHKKLINRELLPEAVKKSDAEVILVLGAGDIGEEVGRIKLALKDES